MRPSVLALVLLAAGCTPDYPFDKPGTWHLDANGGSANGANLRVMVVNPHDLVEGQGAQTALGSEAASPAKRLLTGKRAPLPDSSLLQVLGTSAAAPAQENTDVGE